MVVLVTGAAGFIGYHVARALCQRGDEVLGLDNLNNYYDVKLKARRLAELSPLQNFRFLRIDLADERALAEALAGEPVHRVIHLAAQANVRYSSQNPRAYIQSNIVGHLNVLEFCRSRATIDRLVYASSSSVYGSGTSVPFKESDVTDRPTSLYAATKKADEMMSAVYSDLHGLAQVGLRFFSAYGPWGRPDMAYWLFTDAILSGRPIQIFNNGAMERDFTYVDDIVAGILAAADIGPGSERHKIYNIGASQPVRLLDMVSTLERLLGRPAAIEYLPLQPGDVPVTYADAGALQKDFGFRPAIALEDGLSRFVSWFRWYHQLQ